MKPIIALFIAFIVVTVLAIVFPPTTEVKTKEAQVVAPIVIPTITKQFKISPTDEKDLLLSVYSDSTIEVLDEWNCDTIYSGKDTSDAIALILRISDEHLSIQLKNCWDTDIKPPYAFASLYQCIEWGDSLCTATIRGDTVVGYY